VLYPSGRISRILTGAARNLSTQLAGPADAIRFLAANLHQDGYGFVCRIPRCRSFDRDVFIPRDAIGDAMHGDHVQI